MGFMGEIDDDDVRAKVLVCRQKGLSVFEVDGQSRLVRAAATDPLTGRHFYLMLSGATSPDDFTFAELIDGHTRDVDGNYVNTDASGPWAPNTSVNDFLNVVGGELDDDFWDDVLASFLDVYRTIDSAISAALHQAEYELGLGMTEICQETATNTSDDGDSEARFGAFADACQRRAPFAETIVVEFPDHTQLFAELHGLGPCLPRVSFGYRLGQDDQVAFVATGFDDFINPNLYLNGCRTRPSQLEEDLLEAHSDPWDRHGARNAAQDLLAIQSTAMDFLQAEYSGATKRLDDQRARLALEVFSGYEEREELEVFDRERDEKLREELSGSIKRVEDYLATCCTGGRKTALP